MKITQQLTVIIQGCTITSFNIANTLAEVFYNLGTAPNEQTLTPFAMVPNCDYQVNYKANVVSSSNILTQLP